MEGPLLVDLHDGAPDPVDIVRGRALLVPLHPREQIDLGREVAAMGEDLAQTGAGPGDELGEESIGRAVAVAQKHERGRPLCRGQAVHGDVSGGRRLEHDETGEVQAIELAKAHQRIVGVQHPRLEVHRGEQGAQARLLTVGQRRQHHEARLRRHREACGGEDARTRARNRSGAGGPSRLCRDRPPN